MVGLTLFTPVRRGWVTFLRVGFFLSKYLPFVQNHILQFDFIHFVRWTLVKDKLEGERLRHHYLFFESNFDGPWQHYIDAFAYVIPLDIRMVWGRGPAFPAPPPAGPLKEWIARNSMEGGHYYCAYPHASTRMVKGAVQVRDALDALARDAGRMEPNAFAAGYRRLLTENQQHL
jgi:hypothetical protein